MQGRAARACWESPSSTRPARRSAKPYSSDNLCDSGNSSQARASRDITAGPKGTILTTAWIARRKSPRAAWALVIAKFRNEPIEKQTSSPGRPLYGGSVAAASSPMERHSGKISAAPPRPFGPFGIPRRGRHPQEILPCRQMIGVLANRPLHRVLRHAMVIEMKPRSPDLAAGSRAVRIKPLLAPLSEARLAASGGSRVGC